MESEYFFKNADSYDTPDNIPVSTLFKLMFRSRWYFYGVNFGVFILSGRCGARGELDKFNQIHYSNYNTKLVEKCGGKVHLRGLDNLRALEGKPVVLIGNHMSLLETAMFHSVAREYVDFSFIIKESLNKVPYFKHILSSLKAIAVSRTNPREDLKTVLTEGKKVLEGGRSIIVFPQATRSEQFDEEKFNSIGIKLAKSAGVPVVPFALKTDFLGNGKKIRDLGPIHPEKDVWFEFAPAMEITGNGQEQQQEIIRFIKSRLAQWNKQG
ncbi:MAG: 1-acyl-sn-glycerol-3-phosphate acyltransferase [Lentisphaeria bacterium]|nr:1-acyl-sn-glycerol-3-phosphate acyltransferase [Lentisphaeria bacterium]